MAEFNDFMWGDVKYPEAYLRTIFNFSAERKFKVGIEIGFDQGASALALLRGSPDATLLSVDIFACEGGRAVLARSDVANRHSFVQADSRVYLASAEAHPKYELIYIDGDHLYDAVRLDIENASKLLQEGGVILLDDAVPNHGHFGVYRALDEFVVNNPGWKHHPIVGSPSSLEVLYRV